MRKNLPLFLIALSTSSLLAQTPATPVLVVPAQVQTSAAKLTTSATKPSSTSTPAPAQAQPSNAPSPAATRINRLRALTFDRRPSTILKAWAPQQPTTPEEKPIGTDANSKAPDPKSIELDKEIATFQRAVTLGKWPEVKTYLASLPGDEAQPAYMQLLQNLQQGPPIQQAVTSRTVAGGVEVSAPISPLAMQYAEKNSFSLEDLFGIASAAPPLKKEAPKNADREKLALWGAILQATVQSGILPEIAITRLKVEAAKPQGQAVMTKRQIARLLMNASMPEFSGDFLPTVAQAQQAKDLEALNLLTRHYLSLHAKEAKSGNLERGWEAVQAVLAVPDGSSDEKEEALLRAVELAPKLREELGQAWLAASFTKNTGRGQEILASIGAMVSKGLSTKPTLSDERLGALKLSHTAVDALLKASPQNAKEWAPALTLLAIGWQKEAEFSQRFDRSSGNPRLRRDVYGNIFFSSSDDDDPQTRMMMMQPNAPKAIAVADILKATPTSEWVAALDPGLKPKLADVAARLHLKVNEEDKAFPLIEQMVEAQPAEGKELVKEFLKVWTRNHDPNAARNENRYSWMFFGMEQRAETIPLTRSKQERNLQDLSKWAARIRKLPAGAGELDDELLVKAFTACHSSSEVYKTESIEAVFGSMAALKPKTLAGLADQMRVNMAGLWREPANQERNKTKRNKKDIEAEVLRGYQVAQGVVKDGMAKYPDHWALLAARAGLMHDELNYRQELGKSATFSTARDEAFKVYQKAAAEYAKVAPKLSDNEQSITVYEQWFAAALGAVDLGMITEDKQPDWKQPPQIRKAIQALPGELAEKHMGRFANDLFIRMSGAKPHVKFNYLKAGFQIVGDHKQAVEAKKVFDYYKDLVTEIKLDSVVDGSSRVGSGRPFGLFVNIRHTRDIERESGGFGRYLQNQNRMSFSYNYGRPTADYRDRFETAAREALKEQFEVLSITFRDEKVSSRATKDFGWRYTPYAYVLLKPRGPQVDAIPPLRLDMDFLDTSGFFVMPVESPIVPIDCHDKNGDMRPVEKLSITQTLDERQADKGVLVLELKATGVGLVPDMQEMCGQIQPQGFEVTKTDDQGLGVKKFEEDTERNLVVSEHNWTLTLKGVQGQAALPKTFQFASAKVPTQEMVYQRYQDADLQAVEQVIPLEKTYATKGANWFLWSLGLAGSALMITGAALALKPRPAKPQADSTLPEHLDPFVAAGILREIRHKPLLTTTQRDALDRDLQSIELHYFSTIPANGPAPDLKAMVTRWLHLAPA